MYRPCDPCESRVARCDDEITAFQHDSGCSCDYPQAIALPEKALNLPGDER